MIGNFGLAVDPDVGLDQLEGINFPGFINVALFAIVYHIFDLLSLFHPCTWLQFGVWS